ncbi:MAG: zf-HC2 domain-containing protein [Dehalococcoidia bacterium]|nr:zf-HC2 domain-containing protein [Dehalococcoidia bacterium]
MPWPNRHSPLRDKLSPYIDGRLNAREAAAVEAHLQRCEACTRELEELRLTVMALRELPQVEPPRSFALTPAQVGVPASAQTGGRLPARSPSLPLIAAGARIAAAGLAVALAAVVIFDVSTGGNPSPGGPGGGTEMQFAADRNVLEDGLASRNADNSLVTTPSPAPAPATAPTPAAGTTGIGAMDGGTAAGGATGDEAYGGTVGTLGNGDTSSVPPAGGGVAGGPVTGGETPQAMAPALPATGAEAPPATAPALPATGGEAPQTTAPALPATGGAPAPTPAPPEARMQVTNGPSPEAPLALAAGGEAEQSDGGVDTVVLIEIALALALALALAAGLGLALAGRRRRP